MGGHQSGPVPTVSKRSWTLRALRDDASQREDGLEGYGIFCIAMLTIESSPAILLYEIQ